MMRHEPDQRHFNRTEEYGSVQYNRSEEYGSVRYRGTTGQGSRGVESEMSPTTNFLVGEAEEEFSQDTG